MGLKALGCWAWRLERVWPLHPGGGSAWTFLEVGAEEGLGLSISRRRVGEEKEPWAR